MTNHPGNFVIPFGKYKGQPIGQISESVEGLAYLDWLVGQDWLREPLRSSVREFLADPAIQREIDDIIEAKEASNRESPAFRRGEA